MRAIKTYMQAAIEVALQAKRDGDYAIGTVIVNDNKIIARGANRVKIDQDPTHHGEIYAIRKAAKILGRRHLVDCVLYTTHEPCPMCMGAILFARMKGLVFGARTEDMKMYRLRNPNENWSWITIDISSREMISKSYHHIELVEDFMREDCINLFHTSGLIDIA